jgi:hypothetical protein
MSDYVFVVQTNAIEGREKQFGDWLDGHVDDVLATPGIVAAQRYELEQVHTLPEGLERPFQFLTIYEIEGDFEEALAALRAGARSRTLSPDIAETRFNCFYRPVGGRKIARGTGA